MYDAQTTDLTQTTWEDVNTRNQTKMIVNFGHGNYGPEPVRSVTQEIHWAGANSFYMLSATDGQDQALQWTKEDYAALMPTPKEQADAYAGMDYLWRNPSQSEIPTIRWDDYAAYRETPQGQETQVVVEDDVWTEVSGPSRRRKGKSRN
ncbi:uncharacterized protein I303_100449 [Kwoniella dejecticola CBS 10117]|uniref:Uncharacterized protein n=1 Tax=Kwoniella dejecticola CBS 10117 TaxID=1296121 RepID=A0A1A6AEZ4_9TREE|nr:uncharacterized protein I303_00448 [Kwoniella dejecticola CBS 10117]OBR88631.1 hypothetical protein I303_00448 [Kwoniella dejecticola CBS 10117]